MQFSGCTGRELEAEAEAEAVEGHSLFSLLSLPCFFGSRWINTEPLPCSLALSMSARALFSQLDVFVDAPDLTVTAASYNPLTSVLDRFH